MHKAAIPASAGSASAMLLRSPFSHERSVLRLKQKTHTFCCSGVAVAIARLRRLVGPTQRVQRVARGRVASHHSNAARQLPGEACRCGAVAVSRLGLLLQRRLQERP